MKARQQTLHYQRRQSRSLEEAHSQKLDNVRVAEGAHQLTFLYKLGRRPTNFILRDLGTVLEDVVDLFSSSTYRYRHLVDAAVGSGADSSASERDIGEDERPQLRIVTKKIHCLLVYIKGGAGIQTICPNAHA